MKWPKLGTDVGWGAVHFSFAFAKTPCAQQGNCIANALQKAAVTLVLLKLSGRRLYCYGEFYLLSYIVKQFTITLQRVVKFPSAVNTWCSTRVNGQFIC